MVRGRSIEQRGYVDMVGSPRRERIRGGTVGFGGRARIRVGEAGGRVHVGGVAVGRWRRPVLMNPLFWVEP